MDAQTSESDIVLSGSATTLLKPNCQLDNYEKLSQEELVGICKNLETTIKLKDNEIERINKHTDYIIGMYYDVEDKLAQRNSELLSCQTGLKEVQEALNQWRRELACSSLSTDSNRFHLSTTPELSSGTGSSEGDYKVTQQGGEGGSASGTKLDGSPTECQMQKDNKNERRHSSMKANSLETLGKNMHPILHRRQRNANNNSSSFDLERPSCGVDRKSPRRSNTVDETQSTKPHQRSQPPPKALSHPVSEPLRVTYDDRTIVSRSMALAATDIKCQNIDTVLRMSFLRKTHDMSQEGTHFDSRKSETGNYTLNEAGFYEQSITNMADVNGMNNAVNGNGRISPRLRMASSYDLESNNRGNTVRSKVESGSLGCIHSKVNRSTFADVIDDEKCSSGADSFVDDIIESLIRHVCNREEVDTGLSAK